MYCLILNWWKSFSLMPWTPWALRESPLPKKRLCGCCSIGSGINYGGAESFGEATAGQAGNIQPNRLTLGGLTAFGNVLRAKGPNADANFLRAIYDAAPSSNPADAGLIGFIYHEYTHYLDSKHQIPQGFETPARTQYLRGSDQYRRIDLATAIARASLFLMVCRMNMKTLPLMCRP